MVLTYHHRALEPSATGVRTTTYEVRLIIRVAVVVGRLRLGFRLGRTTIVISRYSTICFNTPFA